MSKSALHITYADLIKWVDKRVEGMEWKKQQAQGQGAPNLNPLTREVEIGRQLAKLLKRHKKDPQLNLEDLFKTQKSNANGSGN